MHKMLWSTDRMDLRSQIQNNITISQCMPPFPSATKHTEAIYSNEPQNASPSVCSMVGTLMPPSSLECSSCSARVLYHPNLTTTLPCPSPCFVM